MANFVGSDGDDIFTGGGDADTADGKGGNDQLSGGGGNDTISGGTGADTLNGGDGEDTLYSDVQSPPFNLPYSGGVFTLPVLDTGTEVDTLFGGGGGDRLFAGYGDNVDGGGNGSWGDYLFISFQGASSGVTANFGLASQTIGGGTITGIENISYIQGSNFDDDLTVGNLSFGYSDFTAVFGMGGNDRLVAGYYTGSLFGGDGDDIVDGRGSQYLSTVDGGAGNDTLYTASNTFAAADGGEGNDTIYSHGTTYGGSGNDLIILGFTYYGGGVYGEAGDDEIRAASQGNYISGGAGADRLIGDQGADTLASSDFEANSLTPANDIGLEKDVLTGAGGNDTLSIGYGDDADGGAGSDMLRLSLGGARSGVTFDSFGITGTGPFTFAGGTIENIETFEALRGSNFDDDINIATQGTSITVDAGGGNDTLTSHASSVNFIGGAGNDRFINGIAGDILDGGDGSDTVDYRNATAGVVSKLGRAPDAQGTGPGGDQLFRIENLDGSALGDLLEGSDTRNVMKGMGGNDALYGHGGDDHLDGGIGADSLLGGAGNDEYFVDDFADGTFELANEGNDRVFASVSFVLTAGQSIETLSTSDAAGTGAIDLTGNGFDNTVIGNEGNNVLDGGAGADTLLGGGGNDTLIGGQGAANILQGGTGNDIYIVSVAGDTVVEADNAGTDEIRTTLGSFGMTANIELLTYIGSGNFSATGGGGNDRIKGGAGDDLISGNGGADFMDFSAGGNDSGHGGDGNDGFYFGAAMTALDLADGGAGTGDQIALQGNYAMTFSATSTIEIETLAILSGSDTRFGETGTNRYDYTITTHDANVAAGQRLIVNANGLLAGEDFFFNGSPESNGTFTIFGGFGTDTVIGGAGSDGFFFGEGRLGASDYIDGIAGTEDQIALRGDYAALTAFGANTMRNVDTIALLSATDARFGAPGTAFSYNLRSHDGNVAAGALLTVTGAGLAANEILTFDGAAESNGAFRLIGGAGADILTGGAGDDILFGGHGADSLTGNNGGDRFVYVDAAQSTLAARDTIFGFAAGDRIDLAGIDAIAGGGNDAFDFIGAAAFTAAGQLRVSQSGAEWIVEGDINGDGIADLVVGIVPAGGYVPVEGDFVL